MKPERISIQPTCSPINDKGVTWQTCYFEQNQWFGITDEKQTYEQAVITCQNAGGELASITSESVDDCAFTTMNTAQVKEEMILFSGRYFDLASNWFWCPRLEPGIPETEACDGEISGFLNWYEASEGDCMGGYINKAANESPSYSDYGWLQRNCRSLSNDQVRAMCRLDCDDSGPVTTEVFYDGRVDDGSADFAKDVLYKMY